ncbi:MAG TPA: RDD family protein [Candidatus Altiarchaeales archaeon]|nr:RDD family protein [Candidatus Altiarchaeales archaeon]
MAKAPLVKRIIAYVIDSLIVTAVILVGSVGMSLLAIVAGMISNSLASIIGILAIPVSLLLSLVALVYFLIKDSLNNGASYGKKIMGLKVVNASGGACTLKDSVLRNIIMILGIIELIVILVDKDGDRLGDKVAKTKVVVA